MSLADFFGAAAFGVCMFLCYAVCKIVKELIVLRYDLEKLSLDFVDHDIKQLKFARAKGWIPTQEQEVLE